MKKLLLCASSVGLLALAFAPACGGDVFVTGDAGDSGQSDGSSNDGPLLACGTTTCGATEYCIHPCCGGANECVPLDDGGLCAPGLVMSTMCSSQAPCSMPPCVPPPPYCTTDPMGMCPALERDCYLACA